MWKEIVIDDKKGLKKFIDIDNSWGCIAKVRPTEIEKLKRFLKKEDAHIYIYDDGLFQILLMFNLNPEGWINGLRCVIKWDYSNNEINPRDALYITGIKTREYLEERRPLKIRFAVFSEDEIQNLPDQHILDWYGNIISEVYSELGIKATQFEKYWTFELV